MKKVGWMVALVVALNLSHHFAARAENAFPHLEGPYLGQQPPGKIPELFAPGIVSTGHDELFGCLTPDGRYIFMFGIHRRHERWSEEPLSYPDKLKILNGPGNGSIDIYWVSAKIIDELRRLTPTE
jgi:hypothetical protein